MKFFNFLFAFLLVAALTSCDTTKKVSSTTPSTSATTNSARVDTRQAPTKPTRTKPVKPKMDTDVEVVEVEKPSMEKPSMQKPSTTVKPTKTDVKIPSKNNADDISKTKADVKKPGTPTIGKVPGAITWEAANERYSAEGTFKNWRMTDVKMIGDDLTTLTAKLEIDLTSIWEKSPKLTDHLKADDYFGVAKYQLATIEVTKVAKGAGSYNADMLLKMRGKEQKLKGTFTVTKMKPLTIKGSAMVDRSIFGIGTENTSVPNEIKVMFDTVIPR